eukprot:1232731-Rhodomonas_salina.1
MHTAKSNTGNNVPNPKQRVIRLGFLALDVGVYRLFHSFPFPCVLITYLYLNISAGSTSVPSPLLSSTVCFLHTQVFVSAHLLVRETRRRIKECVLLGDECGASWKVQYTLPYHAMRVPGTPRYLPSTAVAHRLPPGTGVSDVSTASITVKVSRSTGEMLPVQA